MTSDMRKNYNPAIITIHDTKTDQVYKSISLMAIYKTSGLIAAIGDEAQQVMAQNHDNIDVLSPLRNGAIADYPLAEKMFRYMLRQALVVKRIIIKPAVAALVPDETTQVERKALEDALYQSGARKVLITDKMNLDSDEKGLSSYRVIIKITLIDDVTDD